MPAKWNTLGLMKLFLGLTKQVADSVVFQDELAVQGRTNVNRFLLKMLGQQSKLEVSRRLLHNLPETRGLGICVFGYLVEMKFYLHRRLHIRPLLGQRNQVLVEVGALLPKILATQWMRIPRTNFAFIGSIPWSDILLN